MGRRVLLVLGCLALATRADATPEQWIGQTIVDVRVRTVAGAPVESTVIELVETRLGEPLDMAAVRDTIDHLVGLGRYDDVRLTAAPATEVAGVVLTWVLRPIERIVRTTTVGGGELAAPALEAAMDERMGETPPASRAPEIASGVQAFYRDHGYRSAQVVHRLTAREEGALLLSLDIDAGPRTTVSSAAVVGTPNEPASRILAQLALEPGRPYDRVSLQERLLRYENTLRDDGHYQAAVRETTTFSDADHTAAVEVTVDVGPLVRVVYVGDVLPKDTLDTLIPIASERSADEDLLEDGSRRVEAYLRERGYRAAVVPYDRQLRGAQLDVTFTLTRGPLHRVNGVSVAGNLTVARDELEPLLKLTRGDPFVDARTAAIAVAIEELYRVRGYQQVQVTPSVEILPEQLDGGTRFRPVDTRFTIVEGPRTVVDHVTVEGARAVPEATLRASLGIAAGRPFYGPLLSSDRDALERTYRNLGYLSAVVTPAVTVDADGRAAVTWLVREGEQSRVDHVLITGNRRISADVIRRELRLGPGDPLSVDAMAESQQRLSQLGLFRRVRISDLPRSGSAARDLLVAVEEAPATSITYGGGLTVGRRLRQGDDGGPAEERVEVAPRGFLEVSRRNLWGKNRTLSFFARASLRPRDPAADNSDPTDTGGYGLNDYLVTTTFREPRVFGRPGDAQVLAFLERGIRASFTFDRTGFRTDYARRFSAGFTTTFRYTLDNTDIFDEQIAPEDQLLIDRLFPQVRLSTFSGGVLRDSRDDVFEPRGGTVLGVDASVAARAYGSEVGFAKTFFQGFAYRQVRGTGFVLAGGARIGLARGFPYELTQVDENGNPVLDESGQPVVDVVEDLPAAERFFSGGDTTVRGFALDRLGADDTLDPQGFPQGGNGVLVLNAELRAPFWKGLGLVGFVDAGNVFRRAADIEIADLRVGTGFGVRYRSPIGPLRVDLGFKVNPRVLASGSRERGSVLHISLGQAF